MHRGGHVPGHEPPGRPRGLPRNRRGLQALCVGGGRTRLEVRRAHRRGGLGHQDQPLQAHERRVRRLRGQDAPGASGQGAEPRRRTRHRARDGQRRSPPRQGFRGALQPLFQEIGGALSQRKAAFHRGKPLFRYSEGHSSCFSRTKNSSLAATQS